MILVGMVLGLCVFACGEESEEEPQAAAPDGGSGSNKMAIPRCAGLVYR